MMGMLLMSVHSFNILRKMRSLQKWNKGMDINPEAETSDTTQYQVASLDCVENEYCANDLRVLINYPDCVPSNNLFPTAMASGFDQCSFNPCDSRSDDEQYATPNNVLETTPERSDRAVHSLTTARLYFCSPHVAPKNWGQINPSLNNYHSNPMRMSITFWLPDITD